MAKTGFWLKGATGKLAGTTMYKDPTTGETIMREIVSPSNPKTRAQNIQRIILSTVGGAYSIMKEICDHSFEGMKQGRETMSYFMKQNLQTCRDAVARMQNEGMSFYQMYNFTPIGRKDFSPNQYQISMGSLPAVEASVISKETTPGSGINMKFGQVLAIKENTYQAVIDALGLQRGDQLTFVSVSRFTAGSAVTSEFNFVRVILDPTSPEDYTQLPLSTEFLDAEGKINAPSIRNEGTEKAIFAIDSTNGLTFSISKRPGNLTNVSACAVIVSRKVGDSWNRSTAYLAYDGSYTYNMGQCLDAIGRASAPVYTGSEQYLNNAGEGGGAAAEAGEQDDENSPVVQSVMVSDDPVIAGTKKVITKANGTTFPVAIVVDGTAANADGKTVAIVKVSDGSVLASVEVADGEFVINANAAKDTDYAVKLDGAATGFTFRIEEAAEQGGGGADAPAIQSVSFGSAPLTEGVLLETTSKSGTLAGTTAHANGQYLSVRDAANDTEVSSNPIENNAFSYQLSGLAVGHNYRIYIVNESDEKLTSIVWGISVIDDGEG